MLDACRELNVALVAYRPLERRRLIPGTAPEARPVSPSSTVGKGKIPSKHAAIEETLQRIAQQRGKTATQVALNWLLRKDERVIPIPGTTNARHAAENIDTLTWQLSDDEFAALGTDGHSMGCPRNASPSQLSLSFPMEHLAPSGFGGRDY